VHDLDGLLTVKVAGEEWDVSGRIVTIYCTSRRIKRSNKQRQFVVSTN